MILRLWHGYAKPKDADTYQSMLLDTILPGIHRVKGCQGSYVLRRDWKDEVEFITLTLWQSVDAIREFAGPTLNKAVIYPAAEQLLVRYDDKSTHYDCFRSE
jgi:hypothetical protein